MIRRWSGLALGVSLMCSSSPAWAEKDKFDLGEPVQVFALRALNPEVSGETLVSIDKYFGPEAKSLKKGLLISFFATYCEPCKREMPYLSALYDTYKDRGLQVLSVSIDREPEQIDFVKNLAAQSNVKFPVLSDRFNIVAKRYFISKLPLVYLVNGDGKVAMVEVGYTDDMTRKLLDEVRKLVGEPATAPIPDGLARFVTGRSAPAPTTTASASAPGANPPDAAVAPAGTPPAATDAVDADDADAKPKGKKGKAKPKAKKKTKK